MAHSLSAKKRIRQNAKHRALNRARKQDLKQTLRTFADVLATGDKAKSTEELRKAVKAVDQVAAKGAIHRNTAARKKSQLQRRVNAVAAKA